MDVSSFFHSCVNSALECNKALKDSIPANLSLKLNKAKSSFIIQANSITKQIEKLYDILSISRKNYFSNYLLKPSINNDYDQIDSAAQSIISTCSKLILELKREILVSETSQQNQEHCEIIIVLIQEHLKQICKIYSEEKAIRIKKSYELRMKSKLEPPRSEKKIDTQNSVLTLPIKNNLEIKHNSDGESLKIQEMNGDVMGSSGSDTEQLSNEDLQLFEAENEQLYNELNMLSDEINRIESKVVQITELQDIFTEKVLDQDKNLDNVLGTVVGSTENVREANEQIRKAIQRNAGLRVWVLFFLLVMSFTLIFLDWYNP